MASTAIPLIRRSPSPAFDSHRQSVISANSAVSSSSASFKTAPLSASSRHSLSLSESSRSSSVQTLGRHRDSDNMNTIQALGNGLRTQEVHIIKVTGDQVLLGAGPVADTLFHKLSGSRLQQNTDDSLEEPSSCVGPPPPSPPASVERDDGFFVPPRMLSSQSEPSPIAHPIVFDEPEPIKELPSLPPSSSTYVTPYTSSLNPPRDSHHRSSTDTKTSYSTSRTITVSSTRPSRSEENAIPTEQPTVPEASRSKGTIHLSPDGYLQPPPMMTHRPARRNTIGSSPRGAGPHSRSSLHVSPVSRPFVYDVGDAEGELASDIQLHAERIRRERMSKRAKQLQEAEAAFTEPMARGSSMGAKEDVVLVGNLIGEDHVNYVLMYNMLTGIRIGVSRCQAKIKRPLTDEDFKARHKFSFDIVGNELTPSAKYDFKFKDYAPWVFRELREDHFQLDPADYLLSLTAKYILSELGSPGKSGSFFYFSRDYRFIIKTIRHSEHKFLLSILKEYYAHVKDNPHTLLSRFYGLHRVKLPHGRKIHFVIMNNLFPPHRDIHETYDLKGSTVGREYPEARAAKNPRAVLKDLNWINRGKTLELGPEKRALLTEQLRRDSDMLKRVNVMDYSLLVGIHNMQRGNRDNVRRNTLKVFSPDIPVRRKPTHLKGDNNPEAMAMRRAMRESDPKRLGRRTIRLPEEDTGDRQHFLFYQNEGGLRATDESNEMMDPIYYLGIIDILTPYSCIKKLEHFWKGLGADRHKISPVPPDEYAERFFSFLKAVMRGGGGAGRFKAE